MAERTPEFYQIDKIVDEAVTGGLLSGDDEGVDTDTRFIRNLAAPLEAANARIRELEGELTRLREIEADARKAGQITKDGKFARLGMKVWHPKHGVIGGIVEIYGDSTVAAFRLGVWDGFGERPEGWNDYLVSDCYSTPEAAQAAKEGKP